MKITTTAIFALLIMIAQTSLAQHSLQGTVKNNKENTTLNGVSVYIPDLKLSASTNNNGQYEFKNIPGGTYLIVANLLGYTSQTKEVNIKENASADFELAPSNQELDEVIITGVSSATEKQSEPIPVSSIAHKDLLENSATNIIDAISIAPGVNQMTHGASISKPFIRGLGYNRVVVVNDGVRQEGQQWFDEFGVEVDEYSVDKVEVLKGPASLSYGSDAMAGVINMIAAPPLAEGQMKGNVLVNYQTNNGLIAESFNLAGNNKGLFWDLRYSNKMAHAYKNQYDGYVANSGYSESNIKGTIGINRKWGYSQLTLSSFDLKLGVIEGARDSATGKFLQHYLVGSNTDSMGIAPESSFKEYNNFPVIHQHIRHYKAVWDNSIALGEGRLNLRLGFQQNNRQEANDMSQGDVFNNYFFLNTVNYDFRYIFPEKNHFEMSVGVNGMDQNSLNKGTAFVIPEYSIFDIGAFAIAKKTFNKLTLSGGLRYDSRKLQGKDLWVDSEGVRLSGPVDGAIANFTAYTSNFSGLSGSLGATYDFTNQFYGKLNIARGYRAPTAAESGANGIHDGTPFYEIGDHNLKAESSLQLDGTLGINTKDFSGEFTGFINQIDNYIFASKLESVLGGDSIRYDPALALAPGPAFKYMQGDAVLTGGELVLNIHPEKLSWLHFDNGFSFVNAVQKNQSDSSKYLPYTPPAKYRTELKFVLNNFKAVHNSYFKIGIDHYFEQNKIYYKYGDETVTPAYTLLNAGIGGDVMAHGKTWLHFYIYGANLGDVAYQSSMSRIKYGDVNNVTGRVGVYNMGRNISIKLVVPLDFKK